MFQQNVITRIIFNFPQIKAWLQISRKLSLHRFYCVHLKGYFLTSSVLVVEAATACKLLLQMRELLSYLHARKEEREREKKEYAPQNSASTSSSHKVSTTLQHHLPPRCLTFRYWSKFHGRHMVHSNFRPSSTWFVHDIICVILKGTKISRAGRNTGVYFTFLSVLKLFHFLILLYTALYRFM